MKSRRILRPKRARNRGLYFLLFTALVVCGCGHDRGTISPQAQSAISRLPGPVVAAFRHDFTGVTSAHARTRIMPDQQFQYEIDFVDDSGKRRSVRYNAAGETLK